MPSKVYKIYTEDQNRSRILAILDECIDGYTAYPAKGAWKGERENSLVIEVLVDHAIEDCVEAGVFAAAARIKALNDQEAVLITSHNVEIFSV